MTTNSQLSTNEPKRKEKQQKQTLSKQPNRNRIREMDITWRDFSGEGEGRNSGGKVQGRRNMVSRHKVVGERSKMVWETEDSENLYVQPMDMN